MALKDVKKYYLDLQDEYLEAQSNKAEMLAEYKQDNITLEQLEEFQKYFDNIEVNYKRLAYVMYLFNLPNRQSKKNKYKKANNKLIEHFEDIKVTEKDVQLENKYILSELQKIIEEGKKDD